MKRANEKFGCTSIVSFFDKSVDFNSFLGITKERVEELKKIAEKTLRLASEIPDRSYYNTTNSKIFGIINNNKYYYKYTYDEKVILLILCVDPQLKAYEISRKYPIPTNREIEMEKDPTNKESLIIRKKRLINALEEEVDKEIGLGFLPFINFERLFHKCFMNENENTLIKTHSKNYFKDLIKIFKDIRNFDDIEKTTFKKIEEAVKDFKSKYSPYDNLFAFNQIYNHTSDYLIISAEEKAIFFINLLDSELEMLKIYIEESTKEQIKYKSKETKGFYDQEIIRLEKLYHKTFCPEKIISEWN